MSASNASHNLRRAAASCRSIGASPEWRRAVSNLSSCRRVRSMKLSPSLKDMAPMDSENPTTFDAAITVLHLDVRTLSFLDAFDKRREALWKDFIAHLPGVNGRGTRPRTKRMGTVPASRSPSGPASAICGLKQRLGETHVPIICSCNFLLVSYKRLCIYDGSTYYEL